MNLTDFVGLLLAMGLAVVGLAIFIWEGGLWPFDVAGGMPDFSLYLPRVLEGDLR